MPNVNESVGFAAASVPLSAAAVRGAYSAPYSAAAPGVQNVRMLLPGQPLPPGVAAIGLALPAGQQP